MPPSPSPDTHPTTSSNTPSISSSTSSGDPADLVTGLDMVLVDAAKGPLRRLLPPARTTLRFAASLAARPEALRAHATSYATELTRIALGHSAATPPPKDKRFADPAWGENPFLRRLLQAHLASTDLTSSLLATADLDWEDEERMRFTLHNLLDALSPSNTPLNPLLWKALIDTGGLSALKGLRRMLQDLSSPPRVPSMVEPTAFQVGRDLATTPGSVVYRTPVFELIHYHPTTPTVYTSPLLMVPPTINKYYIADLAPHRSIVEYYVSQGQQIFMMSWRNPDARHANWNLDTYGAAILDALTAIERITSSPTTSLQAFCSGGILTAMTLAHLASTGELSRIASASFAVTVLDWERAGTITALMDSDVDAATQKSRKKGYLDGAMLAEVFAWMRPNDLIWSYWVNNYLQGRPPTPFDILYWNADTTRMPAALHRDFIEVALKNSLAHPHATHLLSSPVDLSRITTDTYVMAGIADHLCPWQSCYRTTQLLGGSSRFVLSSSGHIASLVNPPQNPKASFHAAPASSPNPEDWLATASATKGSWWPDYVQWLQARSGPEIPTPSLREEVLAHAPGTYVFDR